MLLSEKDMKFKDNTPDVLGFFFFSKWQSNEIRVYHLLVQLSHYKFNFFSA